MEQRVSLVTLGGTDLARSRAFYEALAPAEVVDAVLAEAEAAGATIARPSAPASWGGYSGVFLDPDGLPWEVAHNPHWTIVQDGSIRLS